MGNLKIGIKDVVNELGIKNNRNEFINELTLFLNLIAFDKNSGEYYDVMRLRFYEYMNKWNLDIEKSFSIIAKYVKSHKLPYKIVKDEGFEGIKSEKFILSIFVELYLMMIVVNNDEPSKEKLKAFIHSELNKNKINLNEKDIVISDFDHLFKDKKLFFICKKSLINKRKEIKLAFDETVKAIENRNNIKLKLNYIIHKNNDFGENVILKKDEKIEQIDELKWQIEKLKKDIELNNLIINEYIDKEVSLKNELNKLQLENIELIGYAKEQYSKALIDLVQNMNDSTNGNLLDRLYCYSKGKEETNLMFVATNLFNVLREMGIFPRETIRVGDNVKVEEYSFYNYRLNKDISDINSCEGKVLYPAWFYNNKEILKPYVNIKGE
ncbi:hypothetical protein [Clostridium sp. CCUG 7971]|uniref:hypothetical protein n=1 Tax=Clostridium sp. CCUG 7971 TaxID=2811414 RepID=UPI001ABB10BF|nr:hypothetical protein [Clostridium sp. CCUG 7971]MBO3443253.1 hypothetical protein [Clostridium sp. CCUG 7971]